MTGEDAWTMQAADALPVILVAAFAVPLLVAWRTRLIRVEARIEVPPPEPGEQPSPIRRTRPRDTDGLPSPFRPGELVTPEQATGSSLLPIRVVPKLPVEQAPVTGAEGSRAVPLAVPLAVQQDAVASRRVIPMEQPGVHLPAPVRRRTSGFPGGPDRTVVALPQETPARVRISLARASDDDN